MIILLILLLLFPAVASPATAAAASPIRVLIITGADHPAHRWQETTQAIRSALAESERLDVRVSEDPEILATPIEKRYDVVVLNYCDWEIPSPSKEALGNLAGFVDGGKGLVVIHFSLGAFPSWGEYVNLIGRIWDKVRTHDPYGSLGVKIIDKEHPITRKLGDFEIKDELYFCLTGERKVEVLLTARSKVTGKDEPMGFVFRYGKGRVFHTPLGHSRESLESPTFGELLRRACEWAATGDVKD
jgi:type 1 glutamine amidotransferase